MKNFMKKIFAPLAVFALAIGVSISFSGFDNPLRSKAVESLYYTADYSKALAITSGEFTSSYSDEETVSLTDGTFIKEWKSYGANPNSYAVAGTRFGGKNTGLLASVLTNAPTGITTTYYVSYIAGTAQFGNGVTKVEVDTIGTFGTASFVVGKKMFLQVSQNSDFSSSVEQSVITVATGTHTFSAITPWPNTSYYRIVMERASTSSTNSGSIIASVKFYSEAASVPVSSVSITDPSNTSLSVGQTLLLPVTVLPVDANDKSLTWTSSAPNVLEVDSNGKITAVSAGTARVTATSNYDETKSDFVDFVVTGQATNFDKTITAGGLGLIGTYVDGNYSSDDIVYSITQVMKSTNSTTLDSFQFRGSPSGYIYNKTPFPANIATFRIKLSSSNTESSYALYVGNSANPGSSTTISGTNDSRNPLVIIFDVASIGSFTYFTFTRTATTGTVYVDAISVELVDSDIESARAYANYFLTTLDAECTSLSVSSLTWNSLSDAYNLLSSVAKESLTTENAFFEMNDIQSAMKRYQYIINKYSYVNYMGITVSENSTRSLTRESNYNIYAVVSIGLIGLTSILGYYFINKKKGLG